MSLPNRMNRVEYLGINNRETARNIQATEALANPLNFEVTTKGKDKI
jgi:hypothetical protein